MATKTQKSKEKPATIATSSSNSKKPKSAKEVLSVKKDVKNPSASKSSAKESPRQKTAIRDDKIQAKPNTTESFQLPEELLKNPNIAPIFDVDFYRNVFMSLRSQFDILYEKREKTDEGFAAYDEAVYNITVSSMEDAGAQDFMSYCYKRGKYDFCLMNYEKFMKWSFLAAANGNAFALSKLQIFLMNSIDSILSAGDHSFILGFLELTIDNYIIFLSKLVCDEIVKIMNISPSSLAKMPETYLEQNDQIQRDFDNVKTQAAENVSKSLEKISTQLREYVEEQIQEEKEGRKRQSEERKQALEEKSETEEIKSDEEKENVSSTKKPNKRVSVKKFRW